MRHPSASIWPAPKTARLSASSRQYACGGASIMSALFEESVQILPLEAETASVSQLGSRNGALPRPAPNRLLVNTKVLCRVRSPEPDRLAHSHSVTKCDKMSQL